MMLFKNQARFILLLYFSLFNLLLNAQEPVPVQKSENKVMIDGRIYYVHVVKAGQTLYSISRAYGLKEDAIERENPGVSTSLSIGQVLKIPVSVPHALVLPEKQDTSRYIQHVLQPGETLFSLRGRYNTTLEEIMKANPGLDPSELPIGKTIYIPKPLPVVMEYEYEYHRVRRRETIYGISRQYGITEEELKKHNPELYDTGLRMWQNLKIPVKPIFEDPITLEKDTLEVETLVDSVYSDIYEAYDDLKYRRPGSEIQIAYLIPFDFNPEPIDSTKDAQMEMVDNELTNIRSVMSAEKGAIRPAAIPFLEFLEGTFLALDSLKKEGVSMNVTVFDTKRSPYQVRSIIASGELDHVDMIIGPFFSYNVEIMSSFSKERRIPVIAPFHDSDSLLLSNPFLFQLNPSMMAEMDAISEFVVRNPDYSVLILYDTNDKERAEYLRKSIIRTYSELNPFSHPQIKVVAYDAATRSNLTTQLRENLSAEMPNLVIVPGTYEAFISDAVTKLFYLKREFEIDLIGMPQWSVFQNVELSYLHGLNLRFFTPYYFSFNNQNVINFMSKWRRLYAAEPSAVTRKGCSYALLGHDITWHFVQAFQKHGYDFLRQQESFKPTLLMNSFDFYKNSPRSGFLNRSFRLVRYNPNYTISDEEFNFTLKPGRIIEYTTPDLLPY